MRRYARSGSVVLLMLLLSLTANLWSVAAQTPAQPAVQVECPYVLKSNIQYAWLRFSPSSFSGFGVTLTPGQTVTLNNPPALTWDGVQWWVYVWPNAAPGHGYFWVELNSIQPGCQQPPTPTPVPQPGQGQAGWQSGNIVRVRYNIQFVWFRAAPAPGNPPVYTVFPGTQLVVIQGAVQDSFGQWWWLVKDSRNGVTGWVEQNTVELVTGNPGPFPPPNTPDPSDWHIGDIVRVRYGIAFSWLRYSPSSTSAVAFTAYPGQQLIILQGRLFDGTQNWLNVAIPNWSIQGWVEENSLEFVRRG